MKELKICVIGAGSTYSPELIDGFFNRQDKMKVKEFALMDIHMERLEIVGGLIQRMCQHYENPPKVTMTDDLKTAIEGADYVVTQFRVGLLPARAKDERIGLRHGYIGQETTGPGGFAKALRTIPVILEIAEMMKRYAPGAKLINFTNPSGIITEAVSRYTDVPVVGLCNCPITTFKRTAKNMGWENEDVFFDYFGLNHLAFIKGIYVNGRDVTDETFKKILDHPNCEEMLGYPFHKRQALAMRLLPVSYLQYYFHQKELYEKISSQEKTRGELLIEVDRQLLKDYSDPNLTTKPAGLSQRGGAWYSEAAVSLINSMETNDGATHFVCVPNKGCIEGLDDMAVVEIPAVVSGDRISAFHVGKMPDAIDGLVKHVKAYESLAVKAGAEQSADTALLALISHPFMRSANDAEAILNDIMLEHAEYVHLH
jgi:Alpha-galactosidases/6-phospho-beta-glucosidases, family 4 of glycosyl hydrolases